MWFWFSLSLSGVCQGAMSAPCSLALEWHSEPRGFWMSQRREVSYACLALFQLGAEVTWRQRVCLMGLMAAIVMWFFLVSIYMCPIQSSLIGLALCPQNSLQTRLLVLQGILWALHWWRCPTNILRGAMLGPVIVHTLISTKARGQLTKAIES